MATHSTVLTWRIPGMVKPGGLPSMGSHRVGHDWSDLAAVAAAATQSSPSEGRVHRRTGAKFCLPSALLLPGGPRLTKVLERMWLPKPAGYLPNYEHTHTKKKNPYAAMPLSLKGNQINLVYTQLFWTVKDRELHSALVNRKHMLFLRQSHQKILTVGSVIIIATVLCPAVNSFRQW